MKCMDQLPSVTTCCFCCFLRAGNVIIAMMSFAVGVVLAPNVAYGTVQTPSLFPEEHLSTTYAGVQVALGIISIVLCICSFMLFLGSFCNVPILIEVYQWGALIYCITTTCIYAIMACTAFFVQSHSAAAGSWLVGLIFLNIFLTSYFLIVANSLRMSLLFLHSTEVMY